MAVQIQLSHIRTVKYMDGTVLLFQEQTVLQGMVGRLN